MRSIFAGALLAAASSAFEVMDPSTYEFMHWVSHNGRSYGTNEEFKFRFEQWMEVDKFVKEVNAPGSGYTHTAGHNKFSDFTRMEYQKMLSLKNVDQEDTNEVEPVEEVAAVANGSVDWRDLGCVSAVKDQGACGSCWAFSATETVESAHCAARNPLPVLSPQMLVDCATAEAGFGNNGCMGGWYYWAWNYTSEFGQMLEIDYPYVGKDQTCAYQADKAKVGTVDGGHNVGRSNDAIMNALVNAPVSIAIEADHRSFQTYVSGIFSSTDCGTLIDHAVQMVGYSYTAGASDNYWIVRNSWGASWGDAGYIRILMTEWPGLCAVNMKVYSV